MTKLIWILPMLALALLISACSLELNRTEPMTTVNIWQEAVPLAFAQDNGNLYVVLGVGIETPIFMLFSSTDGGDTWNQVGDDLTLPGVSDGTFSYLLDWGLAISSNGYIHVICVDGGDPNMGVWHQFYNGSSWSEPDMFASLEVFGFGGGISDVEIYLKKSGSNLVAFVKGSYVGMEFSKGTHPYAFFYNGSDWDAGLELFTSIDYYGSTSPLIVSPNNNAYIVFSARADNGHWGLYISEFTGSSWSTPVMFYDYGSSTLYNRISNFDIVSDANNNIHVPFIVYTTSPSAYKMWYIKYNGSSWSTVEQVTALTHWGTFGGNIKIDVDNNNVVHIFSAIRDSDDSYYTELIHAYKNGSWSSETVETLPGDNDHAPVIFMICCHSGDLNRGAIGNYTIIPAPQLIQSTLSAYINRAQTYIDLVNANNFPTSGNVYMEDIVNESVLGEDIASEVTSILVDSTAGWPVNYGHGYVTTMGSYVESNLTNSIDVDEMPATISLDDASEFPASGNGYMGYPFNQDYFEYTGKSGNDLTGVTWPWGYNSAHIVSDRVYINAPQTTGDYFEYTHKDATHFLGVTWPWGAPAEHYIGENINTGGPYDYDYFEYTSKSFNRLKGCTGRTWTHPAGSQVYIASYYQPPTINYVAYNYDSNVNGQIRFLWDNYERKKNGSFDTEQEIDIYPVFVFETLAFLAPTSQGYSYIQYA